MKTRLIVYTYALACAILAALAGCAKSPTAPEAPSASVEADQSVHLILT